MPTIYANTKSPSSIQNSMTRWPLGAIKACEQVIADILEHDASADADIQAKLSHAQRNAARQGQDTKWLQKLRFRVSFKHGRNRGPVPGQNVLPADGEAFYVPSARVADYTTLAGLPPGANPAGRPDIPKQSFHARAVGGTAQLGYQPARIGVGDDKYVRVERPGRTPRAGLGRVYIIQPCRSTDQEDAEEGESTLANCHGRAQSERDNRRIRAKLHDIACQMGPKRAREYRIKDCKPKRKRQQRRKRNQKRDR